MSEQTVFVTTNRDGRQSDVCHLYQDCNSHPRNGYRTVKRSDVPERRICKYCKDLRRRRERGPHADPDPRKLASAHANALLEMDPDDLGGESA